MTLLAGVRVLDLTRLLPGPAATLHLADFGADVVKVEDTGEGDYLRTFPPHVTLDDGRRVNPAFEAINRGKRSICIDLKSAQGRDLFLRLAERADAVVESFRPGVLARLGIGWDALHARNPRLVLCSLSGYGQQGPLAQAAGHDINYCAVAGVLDQNRARGRPAIPGLQLGDVLGGATSALAVLLIALLGVQRGGQGVWIDSAMTDGLLAHHVFPHADLDAGSTPHGEASLLTGGVACYQVYETADGRFLAVGALELKFWHQFCEAVGLPELKPCHWSLGEAPGSAAARATIERVAAHLRQRTRAHWERVLSAADACVTPVLTPAEALRAPQARARGIVHRRGPVTAIGPLAQVGGQPLDVRPAPVAGQHTAELLGELGLDAAAVARLADAGVVRCG
jgi:alpha-methylacyl-CoA racemase